MKQTVFFIGVPKAGTTTIASLLRQHPQLLVSMPKETNYHINESTKGLNYYFNKYFPTRKQNQILIDMSILNMALSEITAERIYKQFPSTKLIVILRDPLQRAISDYKASVRTGKEGNSFEEAFYLEKKRKVNDKYPLKSRLYFSRGLYFQQLKNFLKYFNKDQLLILQYEDFFENKGHHLQIILDFIGADKNIIFDTKIKRNVATYSIRYKKLNHLIYGRSPIKKVIKTIIPSKLILFLTPFFSKFIKYKSNPIEIISQEFRNKLFEFYAEDKRKLISEFAINLEKWSI